jgi:hypothetical protein
LVFSREDFSRHSLSRMVMAESSMVASTIPKSLIYRGIIDAPFSWEVLAVHFGAGKRMDFHVEFHFIFLYPFLDCKAREDK